MRPTPWLLVGAVAVLLAGAAAVHFLVDLSSPAARNSLGLGLAAGSVTTGAAFVLTYLLQTVINRNNLRTSLLMKRDLSLFDFAGVNLKKISLRGRQLLGADLSGANLAGADLRGCDLRAALLQGADLSKADLRGSDLRGANLRNCCLKEAKLWDAKISGADFSGARLRGAALVAVQGQPLEVSEIDEIYAAGGQIKGVYSAERVKDNHSYRSTLLNRADLSDANLTAANLTGAELESADLAYARLSAPRHSVQKPTPSYSVRHKWADILRPTIQGSTYIGDGGANLTGAKIYRADFRGADLNRATLPYSPAEEQIAYSVGEYLIADADLAQDCCGGGADGGLDRRAGAVPPCSGY